MVVSGLEAESGSPGPGMWALTALCSLASSCIIEVNKEKQTLRGPARELRGASVALQDSSVKHPELREENQMLRKQVPQVVSAHTGKGWQVEHPTVGEHAQLGEMRHAGSHSRGHASSWSRVLSQRDLSLQQSERTLWTSVPHCLPLHL